MKKPTLKKFKEIAKACNGNITSIAKAFDVDRTTIHNWSKGDEAFRNTIDDFKGALLDECVTISRAVALGIPDRDDNGKFIGWKERPDPSMLRYFMSTLGRKEGFGESMDITSNGKDIQQPARVLTKDEIKELYKSMNDEY